jgi:hypothetical protein
MPRKETQDNTEIAFSREPYPRRQFYTSVDCRFSGQNLDEEYENLAPLNQIESSILRKNKKQVKEFFSKLPCIKTCMARVEMVAGA